MDPSASMHNGEIVGTSETYVSKSTAEEGAGTVRGLIAKQLRVEAAKTGGAKLTVFEGQDGDFHFNIYASLSNAERGLETVATSIASERVADPK